MAKATDKPHLLKVLVLNAENLFVFLERWDGTEMGQMTEPKWQLSNAGMLDNKPLQKTRDLATTLLNIDPDLIFMTEVGGIESLSPRSRPFGPAGLHTAATLRREGPSIVARTEPGPPDELPVEVAERLETAASRNLGDRARRLTQLQAGLGDTDIVEVDRERPTDAALERAAERSRGDAEPTGALLHAQRLREVAMDPSQQAAQTRIVIG